MFETFGGIWSVAIILLSESKWMWVGLWSRAQIGHPQTTMAPIERHRVEAATKHALLKIRQGCILTDLDSIVPELDRLEQAIWPVHPNTPLTGPDGIATAITHLLSRIQDELKAQYFFHLDQRDVPFFADHQPFGPYVAEKFELANEDITEAGKCLALQRPTACVFHLMRAMELAVQNLGKKLKVQINVKTETWHQIMLHVNKSIELLPSKTPAQKRKKALYAEGSAHLQSVRLAWRNEVMHPKQAYTRQEALDIFNATRAFMSSIASLV
ncbi:hypothetical protein QCM80_41680 [Bradyrhizobium sp. SSUT112]|uniref:hypothetical protein n=1 Tax=Bradyrhizobium sp. SSUT112 TaxID=3040604 RepID=UPI00244A26BC|nr:hypothetical protein [Bradyrhizobium sp. SSUT112]MDH2357053.1 hypothetical protein [Bradyrhizobium sp. SSUT112]